MNNLINRLIDLYPGLFYLKETSEENVIPLYFCDERISDEQLLISNDTPDGIDLYVNSKKGLIISMKMSLDQQGGIMWADNEWLLPDDISIFLFDMNIMVGYYQNDYVFEYDEQLIRRRYTIENIIKDE